MATRADWWLEPGGEHCRFCEHHFHYEAGYFCVHCDQPVCPVCVRFEAVEDRVVCPDCGEAAP